MGVRISNPGLQITGAWANGEIPTLTASGFLQSSGKQLIDTVTTGTVLSNNTSGTAAPQFNSTLDLLSGSASAVAFGFVGSTGTGLYSPQTDYGALAAGGNRIFQFRSSNATSFLELIISGGPILRAQGGTNDDIKLAANGTGNAYLSNNAGSTNGILFRATGPATAGNPSNYLRLLVGDGSGNGPTLVPVAQGTSDTNIDINITPLGNGLVRFSNVSFTANGSVATSLGSVGPTGSHTTVQKWLTVKDQTGNTYYIPGF